MRVKLIVLLVGFKRSFLRRREIIVGRNLDLFKGMKVLEMVKLLVNIKIKEKV